MATVRRKRSESFSLLQRDPGPWSPLLLYWLATLGIIVVFGLVMLYSASYTTGYLRFGDSLHYIKSQVLCLGLGLLLSSLAVFFRDVMHLWGVVLTAWTYATPLFYPTSILTDWMWTIMQFNPRPDA